VVVVADTTPITYLVRAGYADVLPRLFGEVLIPLTVLLELRHKGAPEVVQAWALVPPVWLRVVEWQDPPDDDLLLLDAGERDAISLATEMRADVLLIDERAGRQIAERRGLLVEGTLAVLRDAAARGYLDFDEAIEILLRSGFRASRELIEEIKRSL
jgi:predicted nucleic acid-binding protein